jgi:hypothetical protein
MVHSSNDFASSLFGRKPFRLPTMYTCIHGYGWHICLNAMHTCLRSDRGMYASRSRLIHERIMLCAVRTVQLNSLALCWLDQVVPCTKQIQAPQAGCGCGDCVMAPHLDDAHSDFADPWILRNEIMATYISARLTHALSLVAAALSFPMAMDMSSFDVCCKK